MPKQHRIDGVNGAKSGLAATPERSSGDLACWEACLQSLCWLEPCGSGDAAEDLYGTWLSSSSGQTGEVSEGSIAVEGGAIDGFTYNVTDTTIELTDEPGPKACSQLGTYEWVIEGNVLSLTAVADECEGRKNFLDGFTLERSE